MHLSVEHTHNNELENDLGGAGGPGTAFRTRLARCKVGGFADGFAAGGCGDGGPTNSPGGLASTPFSVCELSAKWRFSFDYNNCIIIESK